MQSNILCLETSAAKCSVALAYGTNDTKYLESREDYSHVSQITLLIKDLLDQAGLTFESLDAVAISGGPGSYTGLRVGASTAKGLCYGLNIPLIAVNTLESIANAVREGNDDKNYCYISTIDARRDEAYVAGYDSTLKEIIAPHAHILTPNSFKVHQSQFDQIIIAGDAASKSKEILNNSAFVYKELFPDASHLVPLARKAHLEGNYVEISHYKPYYLKPPNITVSKKQFFRKN